MLECYGIKKLDDCRGASDGIENSTYFLFAGRDEYILTIFEELSAEELPFFVRLMQWLHERQLPVACPLPSKSGVVLHALSGKPALLFPRLPGRHPSPLTISHCEQVGRSLGRMHSATVHYPERRHNARGTLWMQQGRERLQGLVDADDLDLLDGQITNALELRALSIPMGVIHGDLFHDNALFDDGRLTGVIDFYNACTDILLLDLAIVLNDWCAAQDGGIDEAKARSLLGAYERERPLTTQERQHWQAVLQLAACRFWLSRLLQEKLPARPGVVHAHKPSAEYRQRLCYHQRVTADYL